jgi:hypothetical protein
MAFRSIRFEKVPGDFFCASANVCRADLQDIHAIFHGYIQSSQPTIFCSNRAAPNRTFPDAAILVLAKPIS